MSDGILVNLDTCAREPIHIPGAIQPHGLLFILREPELRIVQVSDNAEAMLGIPSDRLLNQDVSSFLDPEQVEQLRAAFDADDPRDSNPVELGLKTLEAGVTLDGFVHRHDGLSYLELEPVLPAERDRFLDFYKKVSLLTTKLHSASTLSALLSQASVGIRSMTGFDRVMIYRFAESHEGEVIAEARADEMEPYLGLWYPASDIPEQARHMYLLSPIRNIVDADYIPVPVVPAINPDTRRPADMTYTALRSVSPIHCEYLRNMGVTASMSVSIVLNDKLWGLIACHHRTPKIVSYETRKACTFIGQVLSGEISRRETLETSAFQSNATGMQAKFLELMAGSTNPLLGLINSSPNLLDLIPSAGVAVVQGGKAHMLGETPGYEDLMQLVQLLQSAGVSDSFVTRSLKNHFPLTEAMRGTASGLIALLIEREPATYLLFFRPEIAQTVLWGGNPDKPVVPSEDGFQLGPRKSFAAWKEEVKGQSTPWTRNELRAAHELRNLVTVVAYGK